MRAGALDRRISILKKTITEEASGEVTETWTPLVMRWWASRMPVSGEEKANQEQLQSREQVQFKLRYGTEIAELSTLDRIIYPPLSLASPGEAAIEDDRVYEIISVQELGRKEGFLVHTARLVDRIELS